MPSHTLTPEESAHRRGRIIDLRRARTPWDRIGAEFDISPQRAHRIYQDALAEFPVSRLEEHRAEEAELIDRAVGNLLTIAEDDVVIATEKGERARTSTRTRVEAWSALRGWSEHRAKLFGLLAPTKSQVDVVSHDSLSAEMQRLAAELEGNDVRESVPAGAGDDEPA